MTKKSFFTAACIAAALSATAQKDTLSGSPMNDVVVTATKFPIKQSLSGKVVTVITKEQLEKSSGRTIGELLSTQTGVIINGSNNTLGTNQEVYVRGAGNGKTLILMDGVPVYDPSGIFTTFDLNMINVDQVERIEILKGSHSTLYGSDAIAGVINIITKKSGDKKIGVSANLSAGSYGTFKETIGLNGSVKKTSYNAQYTRVDSKGFSSATDKNNAGNFDKDGFAENLFRASVGQKINDRLNLRAYTHIGNYNTDLDAGAFADDRDYTAKQKNAQVGLSGEYKAGKSTIKANYNYNFVDRVYTDDSTHVGGFAKYSRGGFEAKSHFAEVYSNIYLTKNLELLAGADYRRQSTAQDYLSISSFGPFATALGDTARVNQSGAYASLFFKSKCGFNMEAGTRYNNFNQYGNILTYTLNPSYVLNDKYKFFGNISSGFRAPSLYQVFSEYRNPFTELKPEKSLSIEAGAQYTHKKMNLRAVYFMRNVNDVIVFYSAGAPSFASYYRNYDKQKDKGVELEGSYTIGKFNLSANYTYADGIVQTNNNGKDTSFFNFYRRPKHSTNLNANVQATKKLFINAGAQFIGKRQEAIYASAPAVLAAYYTINVYAEYAICKNLKAFADLKNITDQHYTDIRGFNSRRFNFMAGVNVNL